MVVALMVWPVYCVPIEAVTTLSENGIKPARSIEVISFADEEDGVLTKDFLAHGVF
jgi:hypothetical protein